MSEQLEVLDWFISDGIKGLVRERLLRGMKFFKGGAIRHDLARDDVKMALLLVRKANPDEYFTDAELTIIEGRQRILNPRKAHLSPLKAHLDPCEKNTEKRG